MKKDFSGLKTIKVGILGDTATQFLTQGIRGIGYDFGVNFDVWEADFNQIERQTLDPSSELYSFDPELIIIFQSSHKLLGKYNKIKNEQHSTFAQNEIESIDSIYSSISEKSTAKVIFYNYTEIDDAVFGNFANKTESSFLFQLRKLNFSLMEYASSKPDFYLCDISSIQNIVGKLNFFQPSIYISTDMVLSIDVIPSIALKTVNLINSLQGKFKKCLIIDLDNTTWGGIIGDDGIENIQLSSLGIGKAFTEFQHWVKKLKNRGIIIAVCSKNTESVAKEPFEKHPDMVLRLDDISVFMANWDNKADNIRQIQEVLNIGFDSMVFLDDNPFERNIVREHIPEICVPELPEDPANYLEFLYELNLFETTSYSNEDAKRTKLYQIDAERASLKKNIANEDDFLKSLDMLSYINPFNKFNIPRVAQLSQRSNQFNLRTVRYTEQEIELIANSENHFSFVFSLEDKFGDNGLICVIILKAENKDELFIDTWFMSCRVLKRGMENFVLNSIIKSAKKNGFKSLKGEYVVTPKNEMVKDHYQNLGFESQDSFWMLDVDNYQSKPNHINTKEKVNG